MEGDSMSGDALHNISITYAEFSDSYSAEDIAEGFVTKSDSETNLASIQGLRDFSSIFFLVFSISLCFAPIFTSKRLHILT
jgi:hypothetical protein